MRIVPPPSATVDGLPTGIDYEANPAQAADNARSLNGTKDTIAAFRAAALPLHNDGSGGWSKEQYDALQAIK